MKKFIYILILIFILAACNNETNFKEQDENIDVVYPSEATTEGNNFKYRIYTEKDVYDEFSDTAIFAELTYVGDEETIDIYHAASPFFFPIEEKERGFTIDYPMDHSLVVTTLKKDEPLRERYSFSGGYSGDSKEYNDFVETIQNKGFPEGKYVIHGSAKFSTVVPDQATEQDNVDLNIHIGFNVKKGARQ